MHCSQGTRICDVDINAMRQGVVDEDVLEIFPWVQREMSLVLNCMSEFSILRKEVVRYPIYADETQERQQEISTKLRTLLYMRARVDYDFQILTLRFYQLNLPLIFNEHVRLIPYGITVPELTDAMVIHQNQKTSMGVRWHQTRQMLNKYPMITFEKVDEMMMFFGIQEGLNRFIEDAQWQVKYRHNTLEKVPQNNHTRQVVAVMKGCGMAASGRNGKQAKKARRARTEMDGRADLDSVKVYDYSPWVSKNFEEQNKPRVIQFIDDDLVQPLVGCVANHVDYDSMSINIEDVDLEDDGPSRHVIDIIRESNLNIETDEFHTYSCESDFPESEKRSVGLILASVPVNYGSDVVVDLGFSFTISQLGEQLIAQQENWEKTPFTDWMYLLTKTEGFKYHGGHFPYMQLLKFIPRSEVKTYLDFGCGSGFGAVQFGKRLKLTKNAIYCFDNINRLRGEVIPQVTFVDEKAMIKSQYDLITVNNVFHHIGNDFENRLDLVCDLVGSQGTLLVRDHSNSADKAVNVVVVHKMYDKNKGCIDCDPIYLRDCFSIADFVRKKGFYVDIHLDRKSDVGNYVLVCVRVNF